MRRLVDHVLFKLRATEAWVCRCAQMCVPTVDHVSFERIAMSLSTSLPERCTWMPETVAKCIEYAQNVGV